MSQLLKAPEPAKTDTKATGHTDNPLIAAALARARGGLERQEAAELRAAQAAEREQAQAEEDARYRASRTKKVARAEPRGFCSC